MQSTIITKRNNRSFSVLFSTYGIISLLVLLFVVINNNRITALYKPVILLPLSFLIGILIICFSSKKKTKSLVFFLFVSGFFIKNVVSPFLFVLGGCVSFYSANLVSSHILGACIFLSAEFLVILFFSLLIYDRRTNKEYTHPLSFRCNNIYLTLILLGICCFLAFVYFYVSELQTIYYPVWKVDFSKLSEIKWDNDAIVSRTSLKRYLYSLFMFLFPIIRFLLPSYLIGFIKSKYGAKKLSVFLSLISLLIPFILLGGDNLAPFIALFFNVFLIHRLYGRKIRPYIIALSIVVMILVLIIIVAKLADYQEWKGSSGIAVFSQLLYSYFPGFDNVALTMGIRSDNHIQTLFFDFYSGIPFANTVFGLSGETLNDLLASYAQTNGQIVEWGSNIGFYFSYYLSPFISGVFFYYLLKMEQKTKKAKTFWAYFLTMFFVVYSSMSMQIYSTQIYIRLILNLFIPSILLLYLTGSFERHYFAKNEKTIQRIVC